MASEPAIWHDEATGFTVERAEYTALPGGCFYLAYPDDRIDYQVNRGVFQTGATPEQAIERLAYRLARRAA